MSATSLPPTIVSPTEQMADMVKRAIPAMSELYKRAAGMGIPNEDLHFIVAKKDETAKLLFRGVRNRREGLFAELDDVGVLCVQREVVDTLVPMLNVDLPFYTALYRIKPSRLGNETKIVVYDGSRQFAGYVDRDFGVRVEAVLDDGDTSNHYGFRTIQHVLHSQIEYIQSCAVQDIAKLRIQTEDLALFIVIKAGEDNSRPMSVSEHKAGALDGENCVLDIRTYTRQTLIPQITHLGSLGKYLAKPATPGHFWVIFSAFGAVPIYEIPITGDGNLTEVSGAKQ